MVTAEKWCCQTGLNCRPLHYQWSALPLSYGSMPRMRGIGPKGPCKVRRSLPQGHWPRKRGSGLRGSSKTAQISARRPRPASAAAIAGRSGSHFVPGPLERLDRADHALEFGHFAGLVEFDQANDLKLPFADIGGKFQRGVTGACDKAAHRSILRPRGYGSAARSDGSTMKDET